jgi:hypothetical protein
MHSIEFAIQEVVECVSGLDRRNAFDNLHTQLEDQIAHYEAEHLPNVRLPQVAQQDETPNRDDTFAVVQVVVEFTNGRKRFNVRGGRWMRHGVPVYEDSPAFDYVKDFDLGEHNISHGSLVATAQVVNGSPKRVIAMERNS